MKKIIYSLVAMLFVGSIFTSCITNEEPAGVLKMREAHAAYLEALASLTKANEAVAAAEAAYRNAEAAYQQALAAQVQANTKAIELANALQEAQNEQAIANIKDQMEQDRINNAAALASAKAALAQAQKALEDALNAIEIEKLGLSAQELTAINAIKANYDAAAADLVAWYQQYEAYLVTAYNSIYSALLGQAIGYGDDDLSWEIWWDFGLDLNYADTQLAFVEELLKTDELKLQYAQQEAEFWKELLENVDFDYLAEAKAYDDMADAMAPQFAELLRDSVLFEQEYGTARDRAIQAANDAYDAAKGDPKAAYDKAVKAIKDANKNWNKQVNEVAAGDLDNASKKWTAKGSDYSFNKKYALPEHTLGDVLTLYEKQAGLDGFAQQVKFVTTSGKPDSLIVKIDAVAKQADYELIVDTIWNGNQATEALMGMKTGLKSVYDDFGRSHLYDLDAEGIKADKEVLEAYAAKVQNEYDSILAILNAGSKDQAAKLLKAWADKVEKAGKDIDALAKKVNAYQNKPDDAANKPYTYTDGLSEITGKGPIVLVGQTSKPRSVTVSTSDATQFTLADASATYFGGGLVPTNTITIAPTPADSATVFNAIVDYFKAIAAVNEDSVPYLKFMASKDGGMTYDVDSVRADKMVYEGIKVVATNGHIKAENILMAAPYDNKGMTSKDATPAVTAYYDAFTNVINLFNHYVNSATLEANLYKAWDANYQAGTSGVADYIQYVTDFKNNNAAANLDGYQKAFNSYTANDFKKYTAMSDEGKALANWMDAAEKYFGVEGFAAVAENVYFDYETFTDPTNVVIFSAIPSYSKDSKGNVVAIAPVDVVSAWTNQYTFVAKTIWKNLSDKDGSYTAEDYTGWDDAAKAGNANADMVMNSLVFELLRANYLVAVASGDKSISEIWDALGEVLEQVKKDMDAVVASVASTKKANEELAAKFNEALADYRTATKDLADARNAAIKEANDAYDAAAKEILDPIKDEYKALRAEYDYYKGLANALRGAYATIWAGGSADMDAVVDYIMTKYTKALEAIDGLEDEIAKYEYLLGQYDIESPTLDQILELVSEIESIIGTDGLVWGDYGEMDWNEYEDLVFWYEYWKAAYEAAIAKYAE